MNEAPAAVVGWKTLFAILLSAVYAFPTMFLWNWLMPDILGVKAISVFQAFGFLMLGWLLFKSPSHQLE